jgi:hypothetical protein
VRTADTSRIKIIPVTFQPRLPCERDRTKHPAPSCTDVLYSVERITARYRQRRAKRSWNSDVKAAVTRFVASNSRNTNVNCYDSHSHTNTARRRIRRLLGKVLLGGAIPALLVGVLTVAIVPIWVFRKTRKADQETFNEQREADRDLIRQQIDADRKLARGQAALAAARTLTGSIHSARDSLDSALGRRTFSEMEADLSAAWTAWNDSVLLDAPSLLDDGLRDRLKTNTDEFSALCRWVRERPAGLKPVVEDWVAEDPVRSVYLGRHLPLPRYDALTTEAIGVLKDYLAETNHRLDSYRRGELRTQVDEIVSWPDLSASIPLKESDFN